MNRSTVSHNDVQDYYGKTLQSSSDLQSNCCTASEPADHIKKIIGEIEDEVLDRFYGCGSPIPESLEGLTVLDLGCGTGRDCYILSKLVGENGRVIGVDMTDEQLDVARRNQDKMAENFGYEKSNVEFIKAIIEDLSAIVDASVDLVISNCVINLSTHKEKVFSEIFRVLKPGGELYFSDVYSDRRIPQHLRDDTVFYGECLGGALYYEDFRRMMMDIGCLDHRIVSKSVIDLNNKEIEEKAGNIVFYTITVRAFKLDSLEDECEDYGQVAIYKGDITHAENTFILDDHHQFEAGRPMLVCGNTAAMLEETRFATHFQIIGDRSTHFGIFDCSNDVETEAGGSCC